jgi:hypothetical protein
LANAAAPEAGGIHHIAEGLLIECREEGENVGFDGFNALVESEEKGFCGGVVEEFV